LRFWGVSITSLRLSRSRPWPKNDNCFVEHSRCLVARRRSGDPPPFPEPWL
jgi:hypothetical protein